MASAPPLSLSTAAATSTSPWSANHGALAHGAVGVDLDDLLARDEAQRVEVVDVEVAEDAAGARDVRLGGGSGSCVAAPRDEQAAERAARRPPSRAAR